MRDEQGAIGDFLFSSQRVNIPMDDSCIGKGERYDRQRCFYWEKDNFFSHEGVILLRLGRLLQTDAIIIPVEIVKNWQAG